MSYLWYGIVRDGDYNDILLSVAAQATPTNTCNDFNGLSRQRKLLHKDEQIYDAYLSTFLIHYQQTMFEYYRYFLYVYQLLKQLFAIDFYYFSAIGLFKVRI